MPNAHFYVRNHFPMPRIEPLDWRLEVRGVVERPLSLSLRELHTMPSQTAVVTLECAGNGRFMLDPPVPGEQWRLGAVSTAEWTGASLAEVLDRAGVRSNAHEVVFRSADHGVVEGHPAEIRFERSLRVDVARESGALLAYAMNGEPIPVDHGYPVRLIVPDWYGVTSVKWLTEIELVDQPLDAYYQTEKYQYEWETSREPVALQRVRALVTEPTAGDDLDQGDVAIRGVAWSGVAAIARVEVSVDDGSWQEARLVGERHRHSWQWWELIIRRDQPGPLTIRARATDLAGRSQPERPE
jgi:DMSO/TMAO reductase YedYZ molybdopterin-dependent catalytic subunit